MITGMDSDGDRGAAARNNAEWCDAMCRAHGLPGSWGERAWTTARRAPTYYPDAVTLTADASVRDVLGAVDRSAPGCSVKDSYATLDLEAEGFTLLFEAEWIHRPAGLALPAPSAAQWGPVRTPGELTAWERAWSGDDPDLAGLFRVELLTDPSTTVLAGRADGRIVAGAVLSARADSPVVGVSNLFAADDTSAAADDAWAGCLSAAASLYPGTPVAGYEHGDDLTAALRHGFTPTGSLRIWLDTTA